MLNGKWVLEGKLAEADPGTGGTVWQATRVGDKTNRKYVVKQVAADQEVVGRLISHELQAKRIRSHHVVQIVAHGETEDGKYVVSPLYTPGSLYQHCSPDQNRPNLKWCAQRMAEVLSGLMDASELWLTHLDIKPQNIVLDGDRARIIDWGLSRKRNAAETSRVWGGRRSTPAPSR